MKKNLLAALVSMTLAYESLISPNLMASPISTTLNMVTSSTTTNLLNDTNNENFSWDNTTVYFVLTDRFVNGNTSNDNSYGRVKTDSWGKNIGTFHGGDIAGLTQKLNDGYFEELGVNTIWLSAPYEQAHGFVGGGNNGDFAHYSYHGYYPLDYTMMDKNMGTIEEMREFVDTAHEKGIRVVLDIVMNHVGYLTLQDMADYNINPSNTSLSALANWRPNQSTGETWHSYHSSLLDYNGHANEWAKWWSPGWIRAGVAGYTAGGSSDITLNLSGLPDVKTEVTSNQGLAPILKTKWAKESSGYDDWIVPAAKELRCDLGISPSDYQIKWLASWVKEFGIDGFRVDTAKHVDMFRWAQLKDACTEALEEWRQNNPNKPGADWDEAFWTTAEVFDHGANKSNYHSAGKFDSIINFSFPTDGNISSIDTTYQNYANNINSSNDWNILSYISSHDTVLSRSNMINLGSTLLLSPGGVQIFYGDETNRPYGENGSDKDQGTRSDMNWSSMDTASLTHWQKVGQFRNEHIAIGAGTHTKLNSSPYTFQRSYHKNGIDDDVIVVLGASGTTTINVSSIFSDGSKVRDAYTGTKATVQNGKVTISPNQNGVILLELTSSSSTIPTVNEDELKLFIYKPEGWGTSLNAYVYNDDSTNVDIISAWPGTSMTNEGNNLYSITLDAKWLNSKVIFNDGKVQYPASTGLTVDASRCYIDGSWELCPVIKEITQTTSLKAYFDNSSYNWSNLHAYIYNENESGVEMISAWPGVSMTNEGNNIYSYELPKSWENAYVIFNNGNSLQYPASGETGLPLTRDNSKMIYTNNEWITYSDEIIPKSAKVYFNNNAYNWSNVNTYIYDTSSGSVLEISAWPGVSMTNEGNNIYSYTFTESWNNPKVIFTNGSAQIPAQGQTGFDLEDNMILDNGNWILFNN